MEFVKITESNYLEVASIYKQGIKTGLATFETETPNWKVWDKKHLPFCRFALLDDKKMCGWVSLAAVSERYVYRGVAEVSIYIAKASRGKGYGKLLLNKLIKESENNGIWSLRSVLITDNIPSLKLHLNCGFREVGYYEKVGELNGVWLNNTVLERRSKTI